MTESGTVAHSPAVTVQRPRRVASPECVARAENGRVETAMAAARVWQTLTTAGAAHQFDASEGRRRTEATT